MGSCSAEKVSRYPDSYQEISLKELKSFDMAGTATPMIVRSLTRLVSVQHVTSAMLLPAL